ncbi:Nif3-like dinuclear metal center hexameric protein [Desulfohalovibrio reitneri]|uniref:Nif3-like dinuclear metal center hexameric protein n=1 Tax=Desulfohalovibrio reitneri TaxID=1307759 RepID=UPI0004A754D7|nr:Nif3-like dinuclear metal center hexameric protein [Desulfohalovibrio reitneri]
MRTDELIALIEETAPPGRQESWDNSGLQVAGEREETTRLAVTLDPMPRTISRALDQGADFILCHHPLGIAPRLPDAPGPFRDVLKLLLCSGTWLYAAHTSLDTAFGGPPTWLGVELGLRGLAPLAPSAGYEGMGLGFLGDLPEPLDESGLLVALADAGAPAKAVAGEARGPIRKLAACPGSGTSLMDAAFAAGADAFVTGDVKYHQAQEARGLVIDVGHFSLEEEMMRRWAGNLARALEPRGVETTFFPGSDPLRQPA